MKYLKILIAIACAVVLGWATLPYWLPVALNQLLPDFQVIRLESSRPGPGGITLRQFELAARDPAQPLRKLSGTELQISYSLATLLHSRIESISLRSLSLELVESADPEPAVSPSIDLRMPARTMRALPLDQWRVEHLKLSLQDAEGNVAELQGTFHGKGQEVQGQLDGSYQEQAWHLAFNADVGSEHRFRLFSDQHERAALELRESQAPTDSGVSSTASLNVDLAQLAALPLPLPAGFPVAGILRLEWDAMLPVALQGHIKQLAELRASGQLQTSQALQFDQPETPATASVSGAMDWILEQGVLSLAPAADQALTINVHKPYPAQLITTACPLQIDLSTRTLLSQHCVLSFDATLPQAAVSGGFRLASFSATAEDHELSGQLQLDGQGTANIPRLRPVTVDWRGAFRLDADAEHAVLQFISPLSVRLDPHDGKAALELELSGKTVDIQQAVPRITAPALQGVGRGNFARLLPPGTLPYAVSGTGIQLGLTHLDVQQNQVQAKGEFQVQGIRMTETPYAVGPMQLGGSLVLDTARLQADWQLDGGRDNAAILRGNTHHRLSNQRTSAQFELAQDDLSKLTTLLASVMQPWPAALSVRDGAITASGSAELSDRTRLGASISIDNAALDWDDYALNGLDLESTLSLLDGAPEASPLELFIASANPGVAIRNIELRAKALPGMRFQLLGFSAELLGGRIFAEPQFIDLSTGPAPLLLRAEGLELVEILRLQGQGQLSGTGIVDGELPLEVSTDGITMADGALWTRTPGGLLNYQADASARAMAADNRGLKIALDALTNFHYAVLRAGADYQRNGQLVLSLRIEGNNPKVQRGRPIHLNLNVEQNLLKLLESLRYADEISERLQQRVE